MREYRLLQHRLTDEFASVYLLASLSPEQMLLYAVELRGEGLNYGIVLDRWRNTRAAIASGKCPCKVSGNKRDGGFRLVFKGSS